MTQEEKRRKKNPDTAYYRYKNVNPKNKVTSDCVYRAITNATGLSYDVVVSSMATLQIKTGYDRGENQLITKYLNSVGWIKMNQPRKADNTKMTGKEFIDTLGKNHKRIILSIGSHHLSCIVDGKFEDIWNCSDNKVGIYWVKAGK